MSVVNWNVGWESLWCLFNSEKKIFFSNSPNRSVKLMNFWLLVKIINSIVLSWTICYSPVKMRQQSAIVLLSVEYVPSIQHLGWVILKKSTHKFRFLPLVFVVILPTIVKRSQSIVQSCWVVSALGLQSSIPGFSHHQLDLFLSWGEFKLCTSLVKSQLSRLWLHKRLWFLIFTNSSRKGSLKLQLWLHC